MESSATPGRSYSHCDPRLGTVITAANRGPETRRRTARAFASRAPLRSEVHHRKQLSTTNKVLYNDALTNSVLVFECHAWNPLLESELTALEAEYMKGCGLATGYNTRSPQANA